ncbi:hypothetical protein DPEC_G00254000 [Dallia pectoralis]|uniref:Uncharacterized protein n=1 Tax=Dallia pectoralis TaxID=75939 RepID=A0ACC2FUH1_DALPE|nr:hypothetical protein DPEC_G00254000 [Dallia pectoralis]
MEPSERAKRQNLNRGVNKHKQCPVGAARGDSERGGRPKERGQLKPGGRGEGPRRCAEWISLSFTLAPVAPANSCVALTFTGKKIFPFRTRQ